MFLKKFLRVFKNSQDFKLSETISNWVVLKCFEELYESDRGLLRGLNKFRKI